VTGDMLHAQTCLRDRLQMTFPTYLQSLKLTNLSYLSLGNTGTLPTGRLYTGLMEF